MFRSTSIIVFATAVIAFGGVLASAYSPQPANGDPTKPLKWKKNEVTISVSRSYLESQLDPETKRDFMKLLRESFSSWSEEADIRFNFEIVKEETVSERDSGGDGISLLTMAPTSGNLLLFGERKTGVSALTRIFYDSEGFITEADIVLNPTSRFTTDGSGGSFDLQATVTHEAGHLLGLGHSGIVGATMHRHQGKNGVFGLPADYSRTLSEDDAAGARFLYGPPAGRTNAFGALSGSLESLNEKVDFSGSEVWLESADSGRVAAGIEAGKDGKFHIASIVAGDYNVFARSPNSATLTPIGARVSVNSNEESHVILSVDLPRQNARLDSFGSNSQISSLAITVNRGSAHMIYVRGKSLDPKRTWIESSSPLISIDPDSVSRQYVQAGSVVLGFEIQIPNKVEAGEYSFRVYENGWLIGIVPGVLSVVNDSKESN